MHLHRFEKIWLYLGGTTLLVFLTIIGISAFYYGNQPPSCLATINTDKIDVTPPFNQPGVHKIKDGEYEVSIVVAAFAFFPNKVTVPKGSIVHFSVVTKDVVHGFEIAGTNVNMLVEPGYISAYTQKFNKAGEYLILCNEYCGMGHHMMHARIEVVEA